METTIENKDRSESAKKSAEAFAETAKATVQDGIEHAQNTMDRVSTQAQDEFRKVSDQTTSFVRENPGVAIAGAVGVGVLIGLAIRPRY